MRPESTKKPGAINAACLAALETKLPDEAGPHKPERHAADLSPPALLTEGQAATLLGIGRRKFHDIRQEPWFVAKCTAVELGPRALRFFRDELLAAAKNAPRRTVQPEPAQLLRDRIERMKVAA
jgi:hypothetical protein